MLATPDLNLGANLLGAPLSGTTRMRLHALMSADSDRARSDAWDDAKGIILQPQGGDGLGLTLWQAVLAVDPDFHRAQPPVRRWIDDEAHEMGGYSVQASDWTLLPSDDTIRQALTYALN